MAENVRLRDIPGANYRDDELGGIHQKGLKELLEALTLGKKGQAYDLDSGRWPEMIGEAVTVGEMEWVITAARRENQITQESGEALQGNFMVVDFDLSNNSNEQVRLYPSSFSLLRSQGRRFEIISNMSRYVPSDRRPFSQLIAPGTNLTGRVIFEVESRASGFRFS